MDQKVFVWKDRLVCFDCKYSAMFNVTGRLYLIGCEPNVDGGLQVDCLVWFPGGDIILYTDLIVLSLHVSFARG